MHQVKSKRFWFAVALGIMAIALIFASFRAGWLKPSPPPILRFAYDRFPGSLPPLLAEKLGFLRKGSCTFELVLDRDHMLTNSRFAAGFYSGMATTLGSAVASSSAISEQRIVYIKDDSRGADLLLADPAIQDVASLRGKRVGVLVGDFGEYWLDQLLDRAGLDISDVETVPADGHEVPQMIASQDIQAGHSWTPHGERARALGLKTLATTEDDAFVLVDVVVFRQEALTTHRTCIREFLFAWSRAVEHWRAHPDESAQILGQALAMDAKSLTLDGLVLFNRQENLLLLNAPEIGMAVDRYVRYFQKRGVTVPEQLKSQILDTGLIRELLEGQP